MRIVRVPTNYYQQFDADHSLEVPGEAYGGWKRAELQIDLDRTALVLMHAWDCGRREEYPGWWRAVEYIPRSYEICRTVFPPLLRAVRTAKMAVFHVVGNGEYYKSWPGYQRAVELASDISPHPIPRVERDPVMENLYEFKAENCFVGPHNVADVERGQQRLDFPPEARPGGEEGIAENADQLFALCRAAEVNHLVYCGFAINWCLLLSPGGMADMRKHGLMCSAIRQATTAVENKETARDELCKEVALWRVALAFGFVYDLDDFVDALERAASL